VIPWRLIARHPVMAWRLWRDWRRLEQEVGMDQIRHHARTIVNVLTFITAALALPSFGAMVPPEWLPTIVALAAILNTVLSYLRKFTGV